MAIPAFLSLVTYWIFVIVGFSKNHFRYLIDTAWPKAVPIGLRWLVGLIELVSIFILRPITLAVRLFANMVAGHLMLTLLLGSGVIFVAAIPEIGVKGTHRDLLVRPRPVHVPPGDPDRGAPGLHLHSA